MPQHRQAVPAVRIPREIVEFQTIARDSEGLFSGLVTYQPLIKLQLRGGVMFTNDSQSGKRLGRPRSVRDSYSVSELSRATDSEGASLGLQGRLLRLILNSVTDTITNRVYRQRRSSECAGPRFGISTRCKSALDDRAGKAPGDLDSPVPAHRRSKFRPVPRLDSSVVQLEIVAQSSALRRRSLC